MPEERTKIFAVTVVEWLIFRWPETSMTIITMGSIPPSGRIWKQILLASKRHVGWPWEMPLWILSSLKAMAGKLRLRFVRAIGLQVRPGGWAAWCVWRCMLSCTSVQLGTHTCVWANSIMPTQPSFTPS